MRPQSASEVKFKILFISPCGWNKEHSDTKMNHIACSILKLQTILNEQNMKRGNKMFWGTVNWKSQFTNYKSMRDSVQIMHQKYYSAL